MAPCQEANPVPLECGSGPRAAQPAAPRRSPLPAPRAGAAAIYPPGLCRAILAGAEEQLRRERGLAPAAVHQEAEGTGVGLYDLALDDAPLAAMAMSDPDGGGGVTSVPEAGSDSGGSDGETHPSDFSPARFPQSISHEAGGSARFPQSIGREAGGLLPEAEGPALQDEDEALREFGLRSLGGDPEYWDDISGASLPAEAVKAARAEEVAFMEGWKC